MRRGKAIGAFAAMLPLALAAGVQAQQVYRIVGPDGRVTFSDRPAAAAGAVEKAAATPPAGDGRPASATNLDTSALPYELRQVVQRYPVTLYTGAECAPCADARSLLRGRGVPFVEKTISSAADAQALARISGGSGLPYATIGQQGLRGFSSAEWTQYLDLAAYPRQSQLPAGFRAPPATPLVAAAPERPVPAAAPAPRPAPAAPPAPAASPSGIQF